jgi:L-2,4-diaminobutyric acid acetyltransferase
MKDMNDFMNSHDRTRSPRSANPSGAVTLRKPVSEDGAAIWNLIRACKPLDENSVYCNLLQCDHFRDTCVVAEKDGEVVGWISGYIVPGEDTLFVWQVAVGEKARGLGLAGKMLDEIMEREECINVDQMKTTITKDNDASWALFRKFARRHGGDLDDDPHFHEDDHFEGRHDTEHMVTITLPEPLAAAA